MMTTPMQWFCRRSGKSKFTEKDIAGMKAAAALNAGAAAFFAYLSRFCAYHRKKSVSRVNFIQKEG